jgi:hypothetical protein
VINRVSFGLLSIAVDGYGRVYVGDIKGIQVFDSDGQYLTNLDSKGVAFGMVFNDKNELFVVARDRVIKYSVQPVRKVAALG